MLRMKKLTAIAAKNVKDAKASYVMKILLVGGGSSHEREVSLKSTDAMERALVELGVDHMRVNLGNEMDVVNHWNDSFDLVLLGFHGSASEDGLLQAMLESYQIPYSGAGVADSLLAFSKDASKRIFKRSGVPTADWRLLFHEPGAPLPVSPIPFPIVIKPDNEGSTIGLAVCQEEQDVVNAQEICGPFHRLIYETFIPGRELTVGVVGSEVFPIVEIFPGHILYDYESKYTKGMSRYVCPAELDRDQSVHIQDLALQAMKALNIQVYGRVDFRLDPNGQAWCLEINTLPGMTETSLLPMGAKAVGIEFPELIQRIIEESLKKY
jgi:D-alanine-D-alanine ligase